MTDRSIRGSGAVKRARKAVEDGDWETAVTAFAGAETDALDAGDLEDWATACHMLGKVSDAVDIHSRVFQLRLDADEPTASARTAFWIVFLLFELGELSQANGWMARGQRLLEDMPDDNVAHSYFLALKAYELVAIRDEREEGIAIADRVIYRTRLAGDHDVEALSLNVKGRALVRGGQVVPGLSVLDEAMVLVMSGELSPVVVGTVYCSVIEACEEVSAFRRAQEWTHSLSEWCDRQQGEVAFTAQCRIHRSKIHQRRGEMGQAEEEAVRAYELYSQTPYAVATGRALYQLAEVYRVRGQLDEAERRYHEAAERGADPQPGLGLVHLARGMPDAAAAGIGRLLAETQLEVERVALLPVYVEVMLAVGDEAAAETAATELAKLASTFDTDSLRATAAQAQGMVALVTGDVGDAMGKLREAAGIWEEMRAPYELARVRVLIGHGCQLLGDEETAELELAAASRQFAAMGVADVAYGLVSDDSPKHGLTSREMDVLACLATGETNGDIAEELYLSVKTIDRHVANILTKLGVSSRTAAVAFAYENHLL